MHAQNLIKMNNEKRELLSKENREDYEEMVAYIRFTMNKSEQQTEEVLMELLDHLLEADSQGKTAKDIFGEDLKAYCDELIAEIPKEQKSRNILFLLYLGLNLIGSVGIILGLLSYGLYQFFDLGSGQFTFHLGSGIMIVIINLLVLALFVFIILLWINGSLFKKKSTKRWVEFLQIWALCTVLIGTFYAVIYFMPSFGELVSINHILTALLSGVIYLVSLMMNKKYRFTK